MFFNDGKRRNNSTRGSIVRDEQHLKTTLSYEHRVAHPHSWHNLRAQIASIVFIVFGVGSSLGCRKLFGPGLRGKQTLYTQRDPFIEIPSSTMSFRLNASIEDNSLPLFLTR